MHIHRLALACVDSVKRLETIAEFERILVQVWKYFADLPMRSQILMQNKKHSDTRGLKLKKACRTRWLSHETAVVAIRSEILAVWQSLKHYEQKSDATAIGLL